MSTCVCVPAFASFNNQPNCGACAVKVRNCASIPLLKRWTDEVGCYLQQWRPAMDTELSAPLHRRSKADKYNSAEFTRAQEAAYARLYPSIFASNYLVLSNRRIHMQQYFSGSESVGQVLDIGAQYCPYYPFFGINACPTPPWIWSIPPSLISLATRKRCRSRIALTTLFSAPRYWNIARTRSGS